MILSSQNPGLRRLPRSANLTDGEVEGGGSFSAILTWHVKLDEKWDALIKWQLSHSPAFLWARVQRF